MLILTDNISTTLQQLYEKTHSKWKIKEILASNENLYNVVIQIIFIRIDKNETKTI